MKRFEEGNPQTEEVKEWVNNLAAQLEEENDNVNYFVSVDYGGIEDDYVVLVHGYYDEEEDRFVVVETAEYELTV